MYRGVRNPSEPTLLAAPQQFRIDSAYCERFVDGFPHKKCFSSLSQSQTRPTFRRQDFSYYRENVTEFISAPAADRSSSFMTQGYNDQEVVKEKYPTAVVRRKAPEIHDYDYGSFYNQASVESSVNFYSHRNVASKLDLPAGNSREFVNGDSHHSYNALHSNDKFTANQWLSNVTETPPPIQSSAVITDSLTVRGEDWCERQRRNSGCSTGSDELSSFLDSGVTDDNNDKCSMNRVLPPCRICGAKASGFHYGVNSCEACKGFFRRALKRPITFHCTKDNTCDIKGNRRSTCRFCRYKRCLRLGMSREAIKTGRYSHRKRTSDIIEVKQLENTPGFPVDEPDFDNVLNTLMAVHDAQGSLKASEKTETEIQEHQSEHIRLHRLTVNSAFTEMDKNDVTSTLTKVTIIANSTISINNNSNNNSSSNSNNKEDGRLTDINNCSNANSRYPNHGAASPSLSSTSNDSGFNEDVLSSTCEDNDKGEVGFCSHGALDLSLKRKRSTETIDVEEEEEAGAVHRVVDDDFLRGPERSLPPHGCHSDLTEISSLKDRRRSTVSEGSVTCYDLTDELLTYPSRDGASDVRLDTGFPEDSDSSLSSGCSQKRRKLERIEDASQQLPRCSLNSLSEQDDPRSIQVEQQWNRGSRGSTIKGDQDGVNPRDEKLSEKISLEAAKKWVAGYINFAKMIPGFNDLPAQTKGVLLRQAWDEVWMLQAYSGYNREMGVATMPSEKCFFQEELNKLWGQENTQAAFDVAQVIKRCRLTPEMLVLLKAMCIVSPDRCPSEGREKVEQIHWCLVTCVFKLIENMSSDDLMTFPKMVTVLTSLRDVSETLQRTRKDGCLDHSFGGALFPGCLSS